MSSSPNSNQSSSLPIARTSIIGAGTIGASWAALFLAHGLEVVLHDPGPDAEPFARAFITRAWPALITLGIAQPEIPWDALRFEADLERAVADADLVQENAPEREAFKIDLYRQLDAAAPAHAILASSTSGLHMSRLQSQCAHPERCVIGHPFNPPHLIPLVEVVGGQHTSNETIERTMAFYRQVGKRPIRINKEVSGHVANRLQAAIWREAVYLAAQGVASVEDIDTAITEGPGVRWAIFGPHMTFNLGGGQGGMAHFLDHFSGPMKSWWDDLGEAPLDETTREILIRGLTEESRGRNIHALAQERDDMLLRVLEAKRGSHQ